LGKPRWGKEINKAFQVNSKPPKFKEEFKGKNKLQTEGILSWTGWNLGLWNHPLKLFGRRPGFCPENKMVEWV